MLADDRAAIVSGRCIRPGLTRRNRRPRLTLKPSRVSPRLVKGKRRTAGASTRPGSALEMNWHPIVPIQRQGTDSEPSARSGIDRRMLPMDAKGNTLICVSPLAEMESDETKYAAAPGVHDRRCRWHHRNDGAFERARDEPGPVGRDVPFSLTISRIAATCICLDR